MEVEVNGSIVFRLGVYTTYGIKRGFKKYGPI
jgi:hypothetical protein